MNKLTSLITLTTDFGVQSQGVGLMEGIILSINPNAKVVHLMHGLPAFGLIETARTLESVQYLPISVHVCVCDPGVGSSRKAIIINTRRGDYLIGPDNGTLIPAAAILGGVNKVVEITNKELMRDEVSPIFHGRDIFSPAAAHITNGIGIDEFGKSLKKSNLIEAVYTEAEIKNNKIDCTIIQINKFGSYHLNLAHSIWDELNLKNFKTILVTINNKHRFKIETGEKFSDVKSGSYLILKDDYGRVEIAKNMGSFFSDFPAKVGDKVVLEI